MKRFFAFQSGSFREIDYRSRVHALRKKMDESGVEAMLITRSADVRYLCGFTGSSAFLMVTAKRAALLTDGRYIAQAREETRRAQVIIAKQRVAAAACAWLALSGVSTCYFDPVSTTVAESERLEKQYRQAAGSRGRTRFFRPLAVSLIAGMRMVKDGAELERIEAAADLGSELYRRILPRIRRGESETAIAGRLEWEARKLGAEGMSFETIVASGARSSFPHGRATSGRMGRGFVTLDFGVMLNGYCSDMTRTVFLGKPTRRECDAYEAVYEAKQAAIATVKPGISCGEVDEAARGILRKAGLARFFTHSTGHGVGLEIHEEPRVAAGEPLRLTAGMVITIEPGVYLPGDFGVRIEDMVTVTATGARVLTSASAAWRNL